MKKLNGIHRVAGAPLPAAISQPPQADASHPTADAHEPPVKHAKAPPSAMPPAPAAPQSQPSAREIAARVGKLLASAPAQAGDLALDIFARPRRPVPKAYQRDILAQAQTAPLHIDGVTLQTYTWGAPTAASTLLLNHGYGMSAAAMCLFVRPLVDAGFRVVSFDWAAHGASGGDILSLGIAAKAVSALAARHTVTGVIAHSAGASTLLMAQADKPLPGNPRFALLNMPTQSRDLFAFIARMNRFPEGVVEEMMRALSRSAHRAPDDIVAQNMTSHVTAETLTFHDQSDPMVTSNDAQWLLSRLPRNRSVVTQGLGHAKSLEDPQVIARVVAFITEARARL